MNDEGGRNLAKESKLNKSACVSVGRSWSIDMNLAVHLQACQTLVWSLRTIYLRYFPNVLFYHWFNTILDMI